MKFTHDDPCQCIIELQKHCNAGYAPAPPKKVQSWTMEDPEFGQIMYTISILMMFSLVIILLMVRSIRRSNSGIEMEALLDAMRFREELDIQERQRRRLMKAKHKVTAWLTKTHGNEGSSKGWKSSPQLIQPRKQTSSTISEIPEIVVTDDGPLSIKRPHTPCLSLIYDFNEHNTSIESIHRYSRTSLCSETSIDQSSLGRNSFSLDTEAHGPKLNMGSQSFSLG